MTDHIANALLVAPHNICDKKGILQILHIDKSKKPPVYRSEPITTPQLLGTFGRLPDKMTRNLAAFSESNLSKSIAAFKTLYDAQSRTESFSGFQKKQLIRYTYDQFMPLKPFFHTVKWYHTYALEKNKFSTAPCLLSEIRPFLKFEIIPGEKGSCISTHIFINEETFPFAAFERHHFFLRKEATYYFLSLSDSQTLDELEQLPATFTSAEEQKQLSEIIAQLEERYPVSKHNLQPAEAVGCKPVPVIVLSELNNAFLMFTPQWSYDGYIVEGDWTPQTTIKTRDGAVIIKRDKDEEQKIRNVLESLHPRFSQQRNGYYYLSFSDAQKKQWFPKVYHKLLLSGIALLGMDLLKHFRYAPYLPETTLGCIEKDSQSITYEVRVQFGKETISLPELQKILWAGQSAILLKDGSLGLLNTDWMAQYATLIKHGKVNKQTLVVPRWLFMSVQNKEEGGARDFESWWSSWKRLQGDAPIYPLPKNIHARLRPYQQKGYDWLCLLADAGAGGCLADDMGLGKTLQAITFLANRLEKQPQAKNLVVCPASLIYNWEQEFQKFAPDIKVQVYHGNNRCNEAVTGSSSQIIITSYGTLRADEAVFTATSFHVLLIDESHNLKNPSARITQSASRIQADYCFALSGTPIVNNTLDLYAQLNMVLPGIFNTREFFKKEYADPIDRWGDAQKQAQLQQLIAPFILRRTKEQVTPDLPEKTELVLWCEMGGLQREAYENLKEQVKGSIFNEIRTNGLERSKLNVLQGILKLRQLCNTPALVPEATPMSNASIKMELLFDELDGLLHQHKVLVFSQFTKMLDLVAANCATKNIAYYHFDGQTPPARRAQMVNAFQNEADTTRLFLISLKAGNAGLNLTAADYVFLLDPWWNEAVQKQAIDRTHRIGQDKKVFAYKMICKDSIEEKILKLQERKQYLADEIINTNDSFIKNLSEEDIQWLFA